MPSKMSAPVAATLSGIMAFTVAAVPTGINAGVRISPRGVLITPVRALPSVWFNENENALVMGVICAKSSAMRSPSLHLGDAKRHQMTLAAF